MRDSMFTFLRSINLSPLEWTKAIQLTGQGSPYIGDVLDAAFSHAVAVVVLMTPDEVAYLRSEYADGETDPQTKPAAQARPNVLFEAGMALGARTERSLSRLGKFVHSVMLGAVTQCGWTMRLQVVKS